MSNPGYVEAQMLKEYLGITANVNEWQLNQAIKAASRAIDNYCGRRFWIDGAVVIRTFAATNPTVLEVPDGIATTTGLIIKTDLAGDGTFETTWTASDYELLPIAAATAFPDAEPWTEIRAAGSLTFPVAAGQGRSDRVQITAQWGWPAVPDPIVSACLIKAARLFHRKDSPQGIAGFGDFGPVRLTSRDGDVTELLDPYRVLVIA